tara:strand:+ start:73 stop:630 length:558 start_codon:yes stop_codon:yes gene_type:complete
MKNKIAKNNFLPKFLILDVDGVFTDGTFYYTTEGKVMKKFGSDDNDALSLLKDKLYIHAISGDKRGFPVTQKRISEDMKLPLDLVSTFERIDWIRQKFDPQQTIYMGDGIFDPMVFKYVAYNIAPANAFCETKQLANFVTQSSGSHGAVAEACLHILKKFFHQSFDPTKINVKHQSGAWKKTNVK